MCNRRLSGHRDLPDGVPFHPRVQDGLPDHVLVHVLVDQFAYDGADGVFPTSSAIVGLE